MTHILDDCGHGTNSDAEWLAAIHALRVARELGAVSVDLRGDSALVVGQARGTARCRSAALRAHREVFQTLAATFETVKIRHVGRSHNLAGIALAACIRAEDRGPLTGPQFTVLVVARQPAIALPSLVRS
ncbi:reverse transcriptase-like protein [Sphingomonas aerolata]|uniref:reverse transcriptase-like protein n=1 Tax=Sphingomonas aerolata TaxID=185951 RepID=UPI002FDF0EE4